LLFVGDDWAEDHHDIEIVDEAGRRLAKRRLPEGLAGLSTLHALIAAQLPEPGLDVDPVQVLASVKVGIETDHGPWVAALVAAGYEVYAINPKKSARYRELHATSGAKSDPGDAHVLAEIVRLLELLGRAPDPDRAAKLSLAKITAALTQARRRDPHTRAVQIQAILRGEQLRQPAAVQAAYAAIVANAVRLIGELNRQVEGLGEVVGEHFGRHRDAEVYLSQPGLGPILAARILGEFGDDPHRFADAKARKNYTGTSPITKTSGTRRAVIARYARNKRLGDAVHQWAFCSLRGSPGAKAYYKAIRPRHRPPSRPATASQPPRRHPARLPEDRHHLRRTHRLEPPHTRRRLTFQNMGCLPRVVRDPDVRTLKAPVAAMARGASGGPGMPVPVRHPEPVPIIIAVEAHSAHQVTCAGAAMFLEVGLDRRTAARSVGPGSCGSVPQGRYSPGRRDTVCGACRRSVRSVSLRPRPRGVLFLGRRRKRRHSACSGGRRRPQDPRRPR
jgi:transposase